MCACDALRSDNQIGDAGAVDLGEALKVNSSIIDLDVSSEILCACCNRLFVLVLKSRACGVRRAGNRICDAGAAAICDALKVNGSITALYLSCELRVA